MLRIVRVNNREIPDQVLLDKYRNTGDIELIGELFSRYMHMIYGVCIKYLKNRDDARDAVLDIFEKLVIEDKLYVIRNIKSWLYVLTKNFCLMELRKRQTAGKKLERMMEYQPEFMESAHEIHPIDEPGSKTENALKECVEKLRDEQKECIRLFYYQNMSYREIARSLKLEEKSIKSHLQNAKRNLKICLEDRNVKKK